MCFFCYLALIEWVVSRLRCVVQWLDCKSHHDLVKCPHKLHGYMCLSFEYAYHLVPLNTMNTISRDTQFLFDVQEAVSVWRCRLTSKEIPMLKMKRSGYRLILSMGIPMPRKGGIYIETGLSSRLHFVLKRLGNSTRFVVFLILQIK